MDLANRNTPATYYKDGNQTITVSGKTLKIETTPGGVEVLSWVIPANETWQVYIQINATRTA